jgi:tetratricopeptide (TPR) repeat protein
VTSKKFKLVTQFLSDTVIRKKVITMRIFTLFIIVIFQFTNIYSQKSANRSEETLKSAIQSLQNRQFETAEKQLREIIKISPQNLDAKVLFGTLLVQTNRVNEGAKILEGILKIKPAHIQANYNLALIYSSKGDNLRAIQHLEAAAGINNKTKIIKTEDTILLLTLARLYISEKRNSDATKVIEKLEKPGTGDVRTLFTLGLMLADLGNYERASQIFEKVNEKNPEVPEVLYNLGISYFNLDRLDEAEAKLQATIIAKPNFPEAYYRVGLIFSARNDSDAAVSYWLKSIELNPKYHEAYFLIGEELLKNKKLPGALLFYQKAAEFEPQNILYQLRVGIAYFRLDRYSDAKKVFDAALAKNPANVNFNFLRGYVARAEGLFDEAIESFDVVLKLSPNNPDVLANLGYIALERGDLLKAEQYLRQTIKLDSGNFSSHYDLGRLLNRQKKFSDAIPILERGAEMNKLDPGIRYQLFVAYTRTKQKEKADGAFSEFKRLEKIFNVGSGSATSKDGLQNLPDLPSNEKLKP